MREQDAPGDAAADEARILAAFAARRARQRQAGILLASLLGLVVGGGVLLRVEPELWVPAVGAIGLAGLFFSLVNWKCPACGARLSTRRSTAGCPECGARLE